MTYANGLNNHPTSNPRSKPNLKVLACALGLIILVELYIKIIGF